MRSTLHLPNTLRRTNRTRGAVRSSAPTLPKPDAALPKPDVDACKVREAGGPLDQAAYVCLCGFAFAAAVSTSVECPHCGSPQAW
jgi:hypothetical protein